jgi:hypothetical protein
MQQTSVKIPELLSSLQLSHSRSVMKMVKTANVQPTKASCNDSDVDSASDGKECSPVGHCSSTVTSDRPSNHGNQSTDIDHDYTAGKFMLFSSHVCDHFRLAKF